MNSSYLVNRRLLSKHPLYLDVWNACNHALPQAQQVVDRVWRELPHVEGLDGELGNQLDRLRVVVHHHELPQLVVRFQSG